MYPSLLQGKKGAMLLLSHAKLYFTSLFDEVQSFVEKIHHSFVNSYPAPFPILLIIVGWQIIYTKDASALIRHVCLYPLIDRSQ